MPTKYQCLCSQCHAEPKLLGRRTVKAHLRRDQKALDSLPASSPDVAAFLQLRVNETRKVLRGIQEGPSVPDLVSDAGRSRQGGSEGALLGHFEIIDICLIDLCNLLIKSRARRPQHA